MQRNYTQILGDPAGGFSFGGGFTDDPANPGVTGNSFADFLLGIPSSGSLIINSGLAGLRHTEFSPYWQDVWKASPKLTLNYGIRYDLFTPQTEIHNRMSNFDFATGKLLLPGQGGSEPGFSTRAMVSTPKHNFAPRFGFAYKLSDKDVLRGAFGVFFISEGQGGNGALSLNPPFVGGASYTNTAVPQQIERTLSGGFPPTNPNNLLTPIDNPSGNIGALPAKGQTPYTQQESLGIQHELTQNLLFSVTYIGWVSRHGADTVDVDSPFLGNAPLQTLRPYYATAPNLTALNTIFQRGQGRYNALQVSLNKRSSHGLSLGANYTWSHSIDDVNIQGPGHQNVRDLDADRSNSNNDLRHRFVVDGLYELPFGRGKPYLGNASGALNQFVGGWDLGGVGQVQTGFPYTISGGAGRPDRTCNGNAPPGGHSVEEWFDVSCFPLPAPVPDLVHGGVYTPYGNAGRNLFLGPGIVNFDLALHKVFNVGEEKRFEYRAEFFNAANHSQFLNPSATVNTGAVGQILSARPSRQIQMVLKFFF